MRSVASLLCRFALVFLLLPTALVSSQGTAPKSRNNKRPIQIINESGTHVLEIYWINPQTKEEVLMSDPHVLPGTDFKLDSFVGHQFAVREKPGKNQECKNQDKVCRIAYFNVSENDDQIAKVNADFELIFVDNKERARKQANELLQECQKLADEKMKNAADKDHSKILQDLILCVQGGVAAELEKVHEEIAFQSSVRTNIAANLENYTCQDDTLESTPDLETTRWYKKGTSRIVHVKFERPASKIHVIEDFIDEEECIAMEEAAKKTLHRATVADGKGGSRLSENRKAMQAGIKVDWAREKDGDPIARLSRRVYDYTNSVLGLDIKEDGQEDLMSIQYKGRGFNDTEPDRYTPHCDGDCTGLPHKYGTRMATIVMYCKIADRGGHTNFRNAGVHIKPKVGDAIFFSYIDPVKKIMDTGFTEHSGCPVFEGDKKIVTQWVRYGVDNENPWDSFNTLGIKHSEVERLEMGEGEDDAEHSFVDAEESDMMYEGALADDDDQMDVEDAASFIDDDAASDDDNYSPMDDDDATAPKTMRA